MMNNMYAINFEEAAKVMPKKIDTNAKAFYVNKCKVHFALDKSNDGESVVLAIRIEDATGNYTTVLCDPRKDRPYTVKGGRVYKPVVDKAVLHCLDKLSERFPINRQLTVFDMLEKEEELAAPTESSMSKTNLDDLIEELITKGYSYEDACDKAEAEFE